MRYRAGRPCCCGVLPADRRERHQPPSASDFLKTAARARSSATGLDGIPFDTGVAAGTVGGAGTIAEFEVVLRQSRVLPMEFNESAWVFMPKTSEEDTARCQVLPGGTRPLTLKNIDSQIIAGSWLHRMKRPCMEYTSLLQRGLCRNAPCCRIILTSTSRPASTPCRCRTQLVVSVLVVLLLPLGLLPLVAGTYRS